VTKDVHPNTIINMSKEGTHPFFLLELSFSTPLRLSSRGVVNWDSKTWQSEYMEFGSLTTDDYTIDRASIRLNNSDGSVSALIQAEGIIDKPASLWIGYNTAQTIPQDEMILLIKGEIETVPFLGKFVDMILTRKSGRDLLVPHPYYHHKNILPAGTKVTLRNRTVIIGG